MRDENAIQVFRRPPNRRQSLPDLSRAEPRINQDSYLIRFKISAIAGRTAPENSQTNWHRLTLVSQSKKATLFQTLAAKSLNSFSGFASKTFSPFHSNLTRIECNA